MKPQSFAYVATSTVEEAVRALGEAGEDAKVLAGGQSLVPMMNLRLARPSVLVDINPIADLAGVEVGPARLSLGALVRHRSLELGVSPGALGRLLREVAGHVAELPVRVRGSVGGSLAHADPAAEWCLVAVALGAEIELAGPDGRRSLGAEEFLEGPFSTALAADELVVAVHLPLRAGWAYGFAEHALTHGSFAQAGACVGLELLDGVVAGCRIAVMGTSGRAERVPAAEAAATGRPAEAAPDAAAEATRDALAPTGYGEVTSDYLRALAGATVLRATAAAAAGTGEAR